MTFGEKSLRQHQSILNRYCLSLTHSKWDAEDLAQDTWLKALGDSKSLEHQNPEALLLKIAKNKWIDQSRRKNVLSRLLKQIEANEIYNNNEPCGIELILHALVKNLPPLQRTVFLLRDVFGFSIMEAAEILDTTDGAIKAALYRARQALKFIRDDLENDTIAFPKSKELQTYLRTFADAHQAGDISKLVELSQRNIAYQIQQNGITKQHIGSQVTLQMVA